MRARTQPRCLGPCRGSEESRKRGGQVLHATLAHEEEEDGGADSGAGGVDERREPPPTRLAEHRGEEQDHCRACEDDGEHVDRSARPRDKREPPGRREPQQECDDSGGEADRGLIAAHRPCGRRRVALGARAGGAKPEDDERHGHDDQREENRVRLRRDTVGTHHEGGEFRCRATRHETTVRCQALLAVFVLAQLVCLEEELPSALRRLRAVVHRDRTSGERLRALKRRLRVRGEAQVRALRGRGAGEQHDQCASVPHRTRATSCCVGLSRGSLAGAKCAVRVWIYLIFFLPSFLPTVDYRTKLPCR